MGKQKDYRWKWMDSGLVVGLDLNGVSMGREEKEEQEGLLGVREGLPTRVSER